MHDIIVIGAGHAGCEAALAAARMGLKVLLLTQNLDTIARMSCNPSIGGVGKGQLVRELDALGGQMAKAADQSGLQFQTLNRSRGYGVRSPRVQCDKHLYHACMKSALEAQPGLQLLQEEASRLWIEGSRLRGIIGSRGTKYPSSSVVLTAGTFLNGLIHMGLQTFPAGRSGEMPSLDLAKELQALGFQAGRLKTGTPMRLNSRSIDFPRCEIQWGDDPPHPLSHFTQTISRAQKPCHITYTREETHRIIRENLDQAPLYCGRIKSIGPRYCPSIEDKVVKFPHKERHQLFLEPEGFDTLETYVNGLSTSLPLDLQLRIVHSIQGLERAEILRPGYAIEYDYYPPTQLEASLETKSLPGLFFAGQINGTTGYEEAAAQGFIAGVNAARRARGQEPWTLGRHESYIGVMIDDLVTKGVDEPYRMFTSRAEYRLSLRADNADLRLMNKGFELGLIDADIHQRLERYKKTIYEAALHDDQDLSPWSARHAQEQIVIERGYAGYIRREKQAAEKMSKWEHVKIPGHMDFSSIPSLPAESRQKLLKILPRTLGQASRIPGISPCDVQILWVHTARLQAANRARPQPEEPCHG